jgi:hypothetical protein
MEKSNKKQLLNLDKPKKFGAWMENLTRVSKNTNQSLIIFQLTIDISFNWTVCFTFGNFEQYRGRHMLWESIYSMVMIITQV